MPLQCIAQLRGHKGPVWTAQWRPGSDELLSCGGLRILIWGRSLASSSSAVHSNHPITNSYSSWKLKSIIYNDEKDSPSLNDPVSSISLHHLLNQETDSNPIENAYPVTIPITNPLVHERTVRNVDWNKNGTLLATASFDSTVTIWAEQDDHIWKCLTKLEGHENEVKSVSWSSNNIELATCSRDKTVWIHSCLSAGLHKTNEFNGVYNNDTSDGDSEKHYPFSCTAILSGHTQDVKCVVWHPYQQLVISASYDNTIRLWSLPNQQTTNLQMNEESEWQCIDVLHGHTSTVWDLSFSPTGTEFVSCSDDKTLRIWSFRQLVFNKLTIPQIDMRTPITSTLLESTFSTQPTSVESTQPFNLSTLSPWWMIQPGFKPTVPSSILLAKHQQTIQHQDNDNNNQLGSNTVNDLAQPNTWSCTAILSDYHSRTIYSVAWHPIWDIIATGCADNGLRIFRRRLQTNINDSINHSNSEWYLEYYLSQAHLSDINSVSWKHSKEEDGSWLLATAGDDQTVKIFKYMYEEQPKI